MLAPAGKCSSTTAVLGFSFCILPILNGLLPIFPKHNTVGYAVLFAY